MVGVPGQDEAMRRTDHTIVEAEKFKAAVEDPQGRLPQIINMVGDAGPGGEDMHFQNVEGTNLTNLADLFTQFATVNRPQIRSGLTDDDFFLLTSHIDAGLKLKIEKGLYVDLERLLPQDKGGPFDPMSSPEEDRLEWVRHEGGTFLEPARKVSRITSFRRWEQAFRSYATIFCGKNPSRSREIWQYISIINTAANSYTWDNVYSYDVVFRQLMEFNPARSWAVTYNQMWNLSMKDPLQKFTPKYGSGGNKVATSPPPGKKPGYCWSFN